MKIDGIGIDLVEFDRIKQMKRETFAKRILSEVELNQYKEIKLDRQKLNFLAGRFAAKEAYTKAYQSFDTPLNMADVSVLNNQQGAPYIQSPYRNQDKVLLSLSHSEHYVVAICTIEKVER